MKPLSTSLFALVLGIASLGTVACSANVAEPSGAPATAGDDAAEPAADPTALSASLPKIEDGATTVRAAGGLEIYFEDLKAAWPVESFKFSMSNPTTLGSSSAGAGAGKASFDGATIAIRPLPGNAALSRRLTQGGTSPTAVIRQQAGKGFIELATLGTVFVTSLTTSFGEGVSETVDLTFGQLSMTRGAVSVSWDQIKNQGKLTGKCMEGSAAKLAPMVQAPSFFRAPAGALAIESAEIAVSNASTLGSATGGASASKAQLDRFEVNSDSNEQSACMVWALMTGAHAKEVSLDSGTTVDQKGNLAVEQSWRACTAFAHTVTLSMAAGDDAMKQTTEFAAGGLLSLDPKTGKPIYGWSFLTNKAIDTCAI